IFITVFWSLMILYQIYFLDMNQITISPLYLNGISFAIFVAQFFLFAARTHDQKT
ncbi:MAG: hypothetical protein JWR19_1995, partial [Pedosphaera sp.]|nr:hypothetical protein [Pedosphaera sp.]